MNYFDYINDLKPNDNLKNDTRARVKFEISKQKIKKNNIKKAYISMAACFIVIVVSVIASKALTKNPDYIGTPTGTPETEQNSSEKILVSVASDGLAAGPQTVLLGDKLYVQYWDESILQETETDDDKIRINKSDVGELVYTIDEDNLVDSTSFKFLNKLDTETAQQNEFYNAKVYKLKNCKNNTVFLVREDKTDAYALFFLVGIHSNNTVSEIIDIYTANGSNPIKYIDVKQQNSESKHIESYINKTIIRDAEAVNSVIDILESCSTKYNIYDMIDNDLVKDEFTGDEYLLELVFDDETRLKVFLHKEYFNFFISQKDEYDYYLFEGTEYDSLMDLFHINDNK